MAAPIGEDPNPVTLHGETSGWSEIYTVMAQIWNMPRHYAKEKILDMRQTDIGKSLMTPRPDTDDRFGEDLRRFVDAMVYKLRKNNHKGRWEELDLRATLSLLRKEVEELEEAIRDGNRIEIELEAADVANFAMMVSAIAIERGK